jgi:hypothetical protein
VWVVVVVVELGIGAGATITGPELVVSVVVVLVTRGESSEQAASNAGAATRETTATIRSEDLAIMVQLLQARSSI